MVNLPGPLQLRTSLSKARSGDRVREDSTQVGGLPAKVSLPVVWGVGLFPLQ